MKLFQKILNFLGIIFLLTIFFHIHAAANWAVDWNPSCNYFAAGGSYVSLHPLYIYSFDRFTNSFTMTDSRQMNAAGDQVWSVAWSPNGNYLAVGTYTGGVNAQLRIYSFNGSRIPGSPLATQNYTNGVNNPYLNAISWHPSGNYIAIGGGDNPASAFPLEIYAFNGTTLTKRDSKTLISMMRDINWDSTGTFLITGGNAASGVDVVYTYSFANSKLSTTFITSKNFGSSPIIYFTSFSPDNKFALLGGNNVTSAYELQSYSFNQGTLSFLDERNYGQYLIAARFSPDQKYVAIGGQNPDSPHEEFEIYGFDSTSTRGVFTTNPIVALHQADAVCSVDWSNDGRYILIGGKSDILKTYRSYYKGLGLYRYDGTTYNVYLDSNVILQNGDNARGSVAFKKGFTVSAGAGVKLNIDAPICTYLDLRTTGSMVLGGDLTLDSNFSLSSGGVIDGCGHSLYLNGDLQIPANSVLEFGGNTVFDAQGHDLILGKYAQLLVDGGVTVTFKNMTIRNTLNTISCPPIRCMDWYSQACFDNVAFAFNDDWAFRNGQFFIHNDVEFTGTSKFSYRSVRPSYITQHANMIFDPLTTFEFYPSTPDNALIKMADKTASIYFDGSTLQTTHTGIRLTKGSWYFDNKVTLSSADNTVLSNLLTATQTLGKRYTNSIAWSPDGRYLALGNSNNQSSEIYRFNKNILSFVMSTLISRDTYSIAWSPDGKYLALGNNNQSNEIYSFDGISLSLTTSTKYLRDTESVAWSPGGKYVAFGNKGPTERSEIFRFDGSSLTLTASTKYQRDTWSVAWSPDGRYVALGNSNTGERSEIYRFDGSSLTLTASTKYQRDTLSVTWSLDGKYLALGNYNTQKSDVYRFDGSSLLLVASTPSTRDTTSIAWSPDGKYVVLGLDSVVSEIYRLDGSSLSLVASTLTARATTSIAWSPDGQYIALGNMSPQTSDVYPITYRYDTFPQGFSNGISFGNSAVGASQDLDVYVLAAARVGIYGKVWHDSINSWNFQSRDSYVSLDRYDSKFRITNDSSVQNWKKNQIIKSSQENTMFLQDNQVWATNMDQLAPEETFEFIDNLIIPDGQLVQFPTSVVIDGQGHDLILGKYAQLLVDGGVTVTFKNMTIRNTLNTISCPPIRCMDWYSQACFDNVTFAFNDDWAFRNGQFFIHNDVEFTGTSKFSYRSVRPSYITQHANMIFDPLTTFEFYPSTTDNALIKMADKTASIYFDGSTLQTTHTGIRLTKGSLYFDNKVTLSSADNTVLSNLLTATQTSATRYTYSIAWSPDGKYIALGNCDNGYSDIYRFNGISLSLVTSTTTARYTYSIAWSPDGKYVALGNSDRSDIYIFNGISLSFLTSITTARDTYSIAWSPDGKYVALGNYHEVGSDIYRFNGSSLSLVTSTPAARHTSSISWSPDGKYVALGNGNAEESDIYRFNGSSLSLVTSSPVARSTQSIAWSPDGRYIALGNGSGESEYSDIYCFNGNTLFLAATTQVELVTKSIAWSPDGKYVALGNGNSDNSDIYRFNGSSLSLVTSTPISRETYSIAWSPDGKYLALGNNSDVEVSDVYPITYRFDTGIQGFINGIIFGDSAVGTSQDLDVNVLGGANIEIAGKIWYDGVN